MHRSIGKLSGESVESVMKKKKNDTVGNICRKGRFKPGMKELGGGWWECELMEPVEEVPLIGLGWVRIGEISE